MSTVVPAAKVAMTLKSVPGPLRQVELSVWMDSFGLTVGVADAATGEANGVMAGEVDETAARRVAATMVAACSFTVKPGVGWASGMLQAASSRATTNVTVRSKSFIGDPSLCCEGL